MMRMETDCWLHVLNRLSISAQKRVEQEFKQGTDCIKDLQKKIEHPPYGLPLISSLPDIPLTDTE